MHVSSQAHIPPEQLEHVQRVLYGQNMGAPVAEGSLDASLQARAKDLDFDLKAYCFKAAPEQLRPPRPVKIGLIQNKIVLPTTYPYAQQAQVHRTACMHACREAWLAPAHTHERPSSSVLFSLLFPRPSGIE
jgi:hypothetical protein